MKQETFEEAVTSRRSIKNLNTAFFAASAPTDRCFMLLRNPRKIISVSPLDPHLPKEAVLAPSRTKEMTSQQEGE